MKDLLIEAMEISEKKKAGKKLTVEEKATLGLAEILGFKSEDWIGCFQEIVKVKGRK